MKNLTNENGADHGHIYRMLKLIRRVEEKVAEVYPTDKIKSPVHLSIGQEAVAVGVCDALDETDFVSGTYRGHASYIAHGGDLPAMIAELYGKAGGISRGKGGSMHLADAKNRILGSSAVVGTTVPISLGFAMGLMRQKKPGIVASFFGDGATEEGAFYESLNFAALKKLPVLFILENNGYAIHTPLSKRWATHDLLKRVETFGIPTESVPDMDVFEIRAAARRLLRGIRAGEGPGFLECKTYRWSEHVGPGQDYESGGYRDRTELEPWQKNDAVAMAARELPASVVSAIDAEVEEQVARAFDFAEASPFPGLHELTEHVYSETANA